jgi:hypothetical protein
MSARGKAFNEVKALLGRLDRSIDEARSKRLGDGPEEHDAAEQSGNSPAPQSGSENSRNPTSGGGSALVGGAPAKPSGDVLIGQSGAPGTWRPADTRADTRGPDRQPPSRTGARPAAPIPGVPLGPATPARPRATEYGRAKPLGGPVPAPAPTGGQPAPGTKNQAGGWQPGKRLPDDDRLIG